MPPTEDKRKAARETIDVLFEISSLLVRLYLNLTSALMRRSGASSLLHSLCPVTFDLILTAAEHKSRSPVAIILCLAHRERRKPRCSSREFSC
jgi:hypothetical protein